MKSKKLSIAIVSAFIAALGLTACSVVTAKENSIVTLKDFNGNEISVNANSIYDKYKDSENGISSFYQAILEVMIRNYFETSDDQEVNSKLAEFKESAKSDVRGDKEKASENASTNGTSYETEWEAILSSKNVENEAELENKYLYEYEKEEYEDRYFETHKGELTNQYIGFSDESGTISPVDDDRHASMFPYHVRHILVKTSAVASDFVTGAITEAEARKLNAVYTDLVSGQYTFGNIASRLSDDGSASSYGDAGIMTTATSFVNEFKLGIYAYDTIYGHGTNGDVSGRDSYLEVNSEYRTGNKTVGAQLEQIGLETVPFDAFAYLGDVANVTKSDKGLQVNEGNDKYYPRNVIWNAFLNLHNVFVITQDHMADFVNSADANNTKVQEVSASYATPALAAEGKTGFRVVQGVNNNKPVLTDEFGRVIIGVRSEYGIHFMIMQRSPFEYSGTIVGYENNAYQYNEVSLDEYYTTYTPSEQNYPVNADSSKKVTYVNYLNAEESVYSKRAKEVEDQIKGFDPMYDYRIFEELQANNQIVINDEKVAENIENFISYKRQYNEWNDSKTLNEAWNSYLDKIALQYEVRDDADGLDESQRLVRVTCGINFKDYEGKSGMWAEGGICYYEK